MEPKAWKRVKTREGARNARFTNSENYLQRSVSLLLEGLMNTMRIVVGLTGWSVTGCVAKDRE